MSKKLITSIFIFISTSFVFGQASITGIVSDSTAEASAGRVKLFRANGMIVDSVDFTNGSYQFNNVSMGNYYVVTKGDTGEYPHHRRTYYGQSPKWSNATLVSITDTIGVDSVDIILIQIPDWSGSNNTGYCSGTILRQTGQRAGDPIPGIDIALEQIPGGIIKADTETDGTGFFEIKKIPNNTKYRLSVDMPGLPMDSSHTVEILAGDSARNLNFMVDTATGSAGIYVASETLTSVYPFKTTEHKRIDVFPNPSSGVYNIELTSANNYVSVFNIEGRKLYASQIVTNKARLDLTGQPKGVYFIEIKDSFGVQTKKIILQ